MNNINRLPLNWANWDAFSARVDLIMWAEPAPTNPRDERYAVVRYHGGIRWARLSPNPDVSVDYSQGCFYDDMPGGAVEAAKRSAGLHKAHVAELVR
jgi:hypothetical protein